MAALYVSLPSSIPALAFDLARQRRKKVTAVHKGNVLKISETLFLREVRSVASEFPDVVYAEQLVDSMAALLVRCADQFDVIVTTNGDILSEEAATSEIFGETISEYLEHKQAVWVFFDNLDKAWSTQGIDPIDAVVLRCLIDAGRKLERDIGKDAHEFHCIVFVRNDVYEHLMQRKADYGKEM
jgi:hypothetical protein